jgi:phthalate 4,5-cis-dihydrodiol dehydrogenase
VDVVRFLAGGLVQSVRSRTWILDPARPTEGSHVTFLDFADGPAATLVYSGYDFFDTDEFHFWIGEEGEHRLSDRHGAARRALRTIGGSDVERALKARGGYQGLPATGSPVEKRSQPHFGVLIAGCERADLRVGPHGVLVYEEQGVREVPVLAGTAAPDKETVIEELYQAARCDRPPLHDAAWGMATMEVCLAIQESSRTNTEITLAHQVPLRDG